MLVEEYDQGTSLSLKFFRSSACDASWAKVTVDYTDTGLYNQNVNIFYVPQLGGSESVLKGGTTSTDNFAVPTPMVGGDALAKGCYNDVSLDLDPAPETWARQGATGGCTQWH